MRGHGRIGVVSLARAEFDAHHERGHGGDDMHDHTTGEIEEAVLEQPAVGGPDLVRDRIICKQRTNQLKSERERQRDRRRLTDDCGPHEHEDEVGLELEPVGGGACDEGWRDDGEHELVDRKELFRDGGRVGVRRAEAGVREEHLGQIATCTRT